MSIPVGGSVIYVNSFYIDEKQTYTHNTEYIVHTHERRGTRPHIFESDSFNVFSVFFCKTYSRTLILCFDHRKIYRKRNTII